MEVFVQNSSIYCIFWLPSVTDRFNPNTQFPDQICYSDTLEEAGGGNQEESHRIGQTHGSYCDGKVSAKYVSEAWSIAKKVIFAVYTEPEFEGRMRSP